MAKKTGSVVFIDAGVEASSQLVAGLAQATEVRVLSPLQDGVKQITSVLQAHPAITEVYIVAHGSPGCLRLGSAQLGLHTLAQYRQQLQTWFAQPDVATLYLYGCQVAAGDAGAEFLAHLRSLTGASIAASPRLVGHASRGGDWQLDTVLGLVPQRSLLTPAAMATYPGILAGADDFANATDLTTTDTGSNVGFTHQTGEPIHDPSVSNLSPSFQQDLNDSAWWKWTATTSGPVTVNTAGSALDTVLAVYTGSTVNSLTLVGRNDNASSGVTSSSVTFTASAGTTYFFAVDGVGSAQGNVTVNLSTPPNITAGQLFSIAENSAVPTPIGTVAATGTGLSWAIAGGNPDNDGDGTSAFAINATTGELTVQDTDDLDFEAFDQFYTLQVTANNGTFTDTESVFVEVTDAQDDPVLVSLTPSQTTTNEGTRITLSGQIFDPDEGEVQTVTIDWGDGTTTVVNSDDLVDIEPVGNKTFARNHTYRDNGQFVVEVTVDDGGGNPVIDTRNITVNNVAPTITQGETTTLNLNEDSSSTFQLSATDPSTLDVLTWSVAGPAANGTANVSASPNGRNQLITYTPNANFSGTDSFQIQVADDDGGTDTITVNVNVAAQPDAPTSLVLNTSSSTINEGDTLSLNGSFADPDVGDSFTVTINWGDGSEATVIANEDLIVNANGTYSFSSDHAYIADTGGVPTGITVSVQDSSGAIASASTPITVNNVAPTITPGPNTSISIDEDESGTVTLTATDPADTSFTWSILTDGTNGTATVSADPTGATQVITYTPDANFSGIDEFVVQVDDGDGGTNTVTVVVGIDPVNDDPTNLQITPSTPGPLDEGTAFTLSGSFQDIDLNDTHTVSIDWGDGTTTVLQDAALTDDGVGGLSFAGIAHTYADEGSGLYTVEVTATDAAGVSISASQDIAVNNVAPTITDPDGTDDGATTLPSVPEDGSTNFTLSATDPGTEDVLTWSILSQGSKGTVTLGTPGANGSQAFTYTPNANFGGPNDTFTIQVSDGDGGLDTIDVTIPIAPSNDPPTIIANQFDITEGEELLIDTNILDAIDIETIDDSQIVFTISGLATGDSFLVNGNVSNPPNTFTRADILAGLVTFQGNGDEIAPSFTITVSDSNGGTASQGANVSFTTVNDAPVFTASNVPFTVAEGGTVPVRANNISATDEETNAQNLTFTISNLVAGEFLVNGTVSDTFTLQQINQNVVRFRHDGSETPPSYTVTVSDGDLTTSRDDVPNFSNVNDAPEILANSLTIEEGGLVTFSPGEINATDVETLDNNLIFSVSNLTGGTFLLNGSDLGNGTFTLEDVILGNVAFEHNGSETAPTYTLTVTDTGTTNGGAPKSASSVVDVDFTRVNDDPVIVSNNPPFTITEGGRLFITTAMIDATDEVGETPQAELEFAVADVQGGFFALGTANTVPITSFTRQDINLRRIVFVHDGTNTPPSYTLTVTDDEGGSATQQFTAALTAVNDAPSITVNQITLTEGDTVTLSSSNLSASDEESTPAELTYTIQSVTNGQFQLSGNPLAVNGTFTQQDVLDGLVTFVHDDSNNAPTYTLTLTDTAVGGSAAITTAPSSATVDFTAVNDAPVVNAVAFTIQEGETFTITPAELTTTDEETTNPSLLEYTVDATTNGVFQLNGADTTSFTQQDIINGDVTFVHDGGELAPSYTLTVSDSGTPDPESTTVSVDLGFTNLNDLPELLANALTITEDETVVFSTDNLSATDLETVDPQLQFTVSGITNGVFIVNGATFNTTATFSLLDVIEGRVSFEHDGSNDAPTYDVVVADGNTPTPGTAGPETVTVDFTRTNDDPVFDAGLGLTIDEGATLVLNSTNISATDEVGETPQAALQYTVSNVLGGRFARSTATTTPITEFTQDDVDRGRIVFVHNGTNTPPSYTLTVTDSEGGSATQDFVGTLVATNDAPSITVNQITLTEGDTITLSSSNLSASDEESTPAELTYTIQSVTNGQFQLSGNPLAVNGTFTQQDVLDGLVTFVHDDSNNAPTYTLTLTDTAVGGSAAITTAPSSATVDFTAVNDAPVINAVAFTIQEGATFQLTPTQLSTTDEETTNPSLLEYTVDATTNGVFQLNGADTTSFTQQDIINGDVTFVHDGGELAPSYTLTVSDSGTPDPESTTVSVDLGFTNLNDLPELLANALTITEDETVVFSTDNLSATDLETVDPQLQFTVSGITNGVFIVNGATFNTTATFSLLDVIEGRVSFEHDGSNDAPTYDVVVADGNTPTPGTAGPETVTVDFTRTNDDPVFDAGLGLTIDEGATLVLNSTNISATDEVGETPQAALQYTVSNVLGGRFARSTATTTPITEFTQDDVDRGRIVFVHNGTNTPPSYTLTVTDSEGGSATQDFVGTLVATNDAPSITVNQITLTEGDTITLSSSNLSASDEESTPAELTYTIQSVTNGQFQLSGNPLAVNGTFTQQDVLDGLVTFVHDDSNNAPTYTLTLTDIAVGGSAAITTAPSSATVDFTAVNDAPVINAVAFTIQEGATFQLTPTQLSTTDEETTNPSLLEYTVDATTNGVFQLNGADTTSFTQQDIINGDVTFVHDGGELAPSYTLTVSDNGTPDPETDTVSVDLGFTNLNDLPELLTNNLVITEGETVLFNTDNLSATDLETIDPQLQFNISNITNGAFIVNGASFDTTATFSLLDVIEGRVSFEHDGSNDAPTYDVVVADGNTPTPGTAGPETVTVDFTRTNDDPVFATGLGLTINEGATLVLNNTNINATDEVGETSQAALQYTATDVLGGFFARSTATTTSITEFTQDDVDRGRIVFVHNGGNTPPSYTLTVTDSEGGSSTESFTGTLVPTNDGPSITVNQIALTEGDTVVLGPTNLQATDEESTAAELEYNVTAVTGGEFQLNGTATTTFTQQDINDRLVSFVHDGLNDAPTYTLTVTDTAVGSTAAITSAPSNGAVTFTAVNDAPELTTTAFTINEGATFDITTAEINATDEESDPTQLVYTVDEALNGEFQLNGTVATTFTQQDIEDGLLTFVHDDSEVGPSFTITLTDNGTPEPETVTETVVPVFNNLNQPPQFTVNQLSPVEGETTVLTLENLAATDDEDAASQLLFSIVAVTGGEFFLNGVSLGSNTFTRGDVSFGRVTFVDNGDEIPPTYTVAVTDTSNATTQEAATINFIGVNDNPTFAQNSFDIEEGGFLTLTPSNLLAQDAETTNPAQLTYTVSDVVAGNFYADSDPNNPITSFTQQDVNNGGVIFIHDGSDTVPSFVITVEDPDGGSATVDGFINQFIGTNDPPVAEDDGGTGFSTTENTALVTPNLLANDSDVDGDSLVISAIAGTAISLNGTVTLASGATVTLNGDGSSITYDPLTAFDTLSVGDSDTETFTYTVSDGNGGTDTANVAIVINGTNDQPVANDDGGGGFITNEDTPFVTPNVLTNDTDIDANDVLSVIGVDTTGTLGVVTNNGDGTFTYDPSGAFDSLPQGGSTTDSFVYTVSDGNGGTSTATVTIDIAGLTDPPVAVDDIGTVSERFSLDLNVLANDTDPDGTLADLSITQINGNGFTVGSRLSLASGSQVIVNADNTLTYLPLSFGGLNQGEVGNDSFTYTIADAEGNQSTATINLTINGYTPPSSSSLRGLFDYEQLLRYNSADATATVPTDAVDGLPIAQFFDENFYLRQYSDVSVLVDAGILASGYNHFVNNGIAEGRNPSILYNEGYYLANNPDVAQAVADGRYSSGLDHFLRVGHTNLRAPSSRFSQTDYLVSNPDVQQGINSGAFSSAFEHYIEMGLDELRQPRLALYNEGYYLLNNQDVVAAIADGRYEDGYEHFVLRGQAEGRNPSSLFNQSAYLAANPDVQTGINNGVFVSAFEHYEQFGRFEGRPLA